MIELIFGLLVIFQFKHLIADYFLQNDYMLGKFKRGWEFFWPLTTHCSVHAFYTLLISAAALKSMGKDQSPCLSFAMIDFCSHFIMDRLKAGPNYLGRYKYLCQHDLKHRESMTAERWRGKYWNNKFFWWSLGVDQMVHHLTDLYIAWRLVCSISG